MGILDIRKEKDAYTKIHAIWEFTGQLCRSYHPDILAVESPFYAKNAQDELELVERRLNGFADNLSAGGMGYGNICDMLLGYNVTYSPDLTGLMARKFPEWGDLVNESITDYRGITSKVIEPAALALYPMAKTIGATEFPDNRANLRHALENRPTVNTDRLVVSQAGILKVGDGIA
jgi:hypothetical protein